MLALRTALLFALLAPQELIVTRPVWYGVRPESPRLPSDRFGLDFTLRPARNTGTATLALLATARLPGRYGAIYGGRINSATEIVAIDSESGRVWHARPERGDAVPLAAAMKPDPGPPRRGEADMEEIETHFNVDLRAQLALPPHQADYAVFLWLDEFTSPVRVAHVPGLPREAPSPPQAAAEIRFRNTERTPQAPRDRIRLALSSTKGETRVHGAVSPALLTGHPSILTVLALEYRGRSLKWRSLPVRAVAAFDFTLPALLGSGGSPQKTFVVAALGQALSNVLVIGPA